MPTAIDIHIGNKIREARMAMTPRMTLVRLGNVVGVSFQQIQKYENGTNRVAGSTLWKLAMALNQPITHFFDGLPSSDTNNEEWDSVMVTARMFHELPDNSVKKDVARLIKSVHAM